MDTEHEKATAKTEQEQERQEKRREKKLKHDELRLFTFLAVILETFMGEDDYDPAMIRKILQGAIVVWNNLSESDDVERITGDKVTAYDPVLAVDWFLKTYQGRHGKIHDPSEIMRMMVGSPDDQPDEKITTTLDKIKDILAEAGLSGAVVVSSDDHSEVMVRLDPSMGMKNQKSRTEQHGSSLEFTHTIEIDSGINGRSEEQCRRTLSDLCYVLCTFGRGSAMVEKLCANMLRSVENHTGFPVAQMVSEFRQTEIETKDSSDNTRPDNITIQ